MKYNPRLAEPKVPSKQIPGNNKPKIYFGTTVSDQKISQKEPAINTSCEIYPKNRHCIRGLNGKHRRWDEILRDILNSKSKIVQNPKQPESDTEDDDDDVEDMPEETGTPTKVYDTSECDGNYILIRTSPEGGALQIYTDGAMTGENLEKQIRRSNRNSKNRIDTVAYLIPETFGVKIIGFNKWYVYYRRLEEQA